MIAHSRLAKVKAMSARELAHRLVYGAYTALERHSLKRLRLTRPGDLRAALVGDIGRASEWATVLLQRRSAGAFFAWQDDPEGVRELFSSDFDAELRDARTIADRVARGEIEFFGRTFRFGDGVDWHADPVTGAGWPRRYHRDVPVHGGDVGYGDVKYVWELNRHQFLVDLAKIAFLDRSPIHATAALRLLRSWQVSVPYATGAPWACALEPAFRAWSWMWAYHLLREVDMIPKEDHLAWLAAFHDHGRFLYRHLELYASPYNHLVGEASALFALGVLFPEFSEAPAWRRRGRRVLESTIHAQFHADGGTVEQSTFYHHATLGFYLLAAVLAQRNECPLSDRVLDAIHRAVEFSSAITQPNGRVPSIGGADDGKPIRLQHLPFWDFRPYHAMGAVLFSSAELKASAGRFFEDALWMLGGAGLSRFRDLPARAPATARAFSASGYFIARTDWSPNADYMCFDCGEQAAGLRPDDVPSAAHGHADCLSVVVALGGRPVLVDPGFFCYNGDPEWEVGFRRTRAHNTLTIDDHDQARHLSKMAWTRTYAARQEGWNPDPKCAWARGSHDGYARGRDGVTHRRTVWLRDEGYVILYDEVLGAGRHAIRAHYQFAPGRLTFDGGSTAVFDGRYELSWTATTDTTASSACGGTGPAEGWVSTSLGVREAAPHLMLDLAFVAPRTALLTILADRQRCPVRPYRIEKIREELPLLAARIWTDGGEDVVLARDGETPDREAVTTSAPLAVIIRRHGGSVVSLGAGGSGRETSRDEGGCAEAKAFEVIARGR